jgi:hypothetical protein
MSRVIQVRTMPRDVACGVCLAPTRNAARMHAGGGRHIESFVCDACLVRVPNSRIVKK